MSDFKVSRVLAQKVWDKLNTSAVPIVDANAFSNMPTIIDDLNDRIKSNQYLPDNVHGFLGLSKSLGVSRFIPIINHTDMAVYYQLCGEIGDRVIENMDGVFGGWQVVPTPASRASLGNLPRKDQVTLLYDHEYFSETFSLASWFQNYKSFTDCIEEITSSTEYGNYVGMTDIANFYDTIDIDMLMSKLEQRVPDLEHHLDLLKVYLNYWNRRLVGYKRSNKGIPQEIISDGSRNLAHFYLHKFDRKIIDYCKPLGVKFVRWADDMLFFGASPQRIESCLYEASRLLLIEGLNLSAPKTEILSRSEFRDYRCLGLLQAVADGNDSEFVRQLEITRRKQNKGERIKFDTAFRAALTYIKRKPHLRSAKNLSYVENSLKRHPEVFTSLSSNQLLSSVVIFKDPSSRLDELKNMANRKPMSGPKAYLLKLIRDEAKNLLTAGVPKSQLHSIINEVGRSSSESELLQKFCIPHTRQSLGP
ncbi:MAG: RNA-directed DNA polymerase [Hyphomicrobiales bacterium]